MSRETRQAIFNKVAPALITQNKKSQNEGGACIYRGPNNTKCAIGFVIPDDHQACNFEGDVYDLLNEFKDLHSLLGFTVDYDYNMMGESNTHVVFLRRLQGIHDFEDVRSWRHHLKVLACDFGLDSSCLEMFKDK